MYSVSSPKGTLQVSVLQDGISLGFYKRADGRPFIPVTVGRTYKVRVVNRGYTRTEVCLGIDGRNVLRDEPADYNSPGLVIPAGGSYEFSGWRVDDDTTRDFIFGDPAKSVAAQATGSASNTGIIGIAAFREKIVSEWKPFFGGAFAGESYPVRDSVRGFSCRSSSLSVTASVAGMAAAGDETCGSALSPGGITGNQSNSGSVGTGIGAAKTDKVGRTRFTRDGSADILIIGYDTFGELVRRGVIADDPDPFPGSTTGYERYRS